MAAQTASKTLPPSSTFAELLRRSRFSKFDPAIRQAYGAPPSYVHRGNFGLKRPIARRKRDSFIVLRNFEEHENYIHWTNANEQVAFMQRFQEHNIAPTLISSTPWYDGLGQMAMQTNSYINSDFCPDDRPDFFPDAFLPKYKQAISSSPIIKEEEKKLPSEDVVESFTNSPMQPPSRSLPSSRTKADAQINMPSNLGTRGKGMYGNKMTADSEVLNDRLTGASRRLGETVLQPNIYAMTPKQFDKYIEKLRKIRPQFMEYVRNQLHEDKTDMTKQRFSHIDPYDIPADHLVYLLGLEAVKKSLHKTFLGEYNESLLRAGEEPKPTSEDDLQKLAQKLANKPQRIRKMPHKFAGLQYAMPTRMETLFSVKPEPGLILQKLLSPSSLFNPNTGYIVAFAGLAARLDHWNAQGGSKGPPVPLLQIFSEDGLVAHRVPVDPDHPESKIELDTSFSERDMRLISFALEETPNVVGKSTGNKPLKEVKFRANVSVLDITDQSWRENPYVPGSIDYMGAQGLRREDKWKRRTGQQNRIALKWSPKHRNPEKPSTGAMDLDTIEFLNSLKKAE